MQQFDVVIVGAGLVGNSLACMLSRFGLQVCLIEMQQLQPSNDNRTLVLTHTSYQILNALGIWPKLAAAANPIKKIHVSHLGHFGSAQFVAAEFKMAEFGYALPAAGLTNGLQEAVTHLKMITLLAPAAVVGIERGAALTKLTIKTAEKNAIIAAPLVIAADGAQSKIRSLENIATEFRDYQQTAIITQVGLEQAHQFTAYERLTATGPLALLPRDKQNCGVIWTVANNEAADILSLSDEEFLVQLQQRFGYRLGKLNRVEERRSYPLQLIHAKEQIRPGLVLLGNAAHSLHPIAGQGFNLGLRDAATLAELLQKTVAANTSLNDFALLQEYQALRAADQKNIIRFTDGVVRLFSQEILANIAGVGLTAINSLPLLKRRLLRKLMGLEQKIPKMFVGVME